MPYRKVHPMPNEQVERNRVIVDLHKTRTDMTLADIGKLFNLRRQRVWQIINQAKKDGHHDK